MSTSDGRPLGAEREALLSPQPHLDITTSPLAGESNGNGSNDGILASTTSPMPQTAVYPRRYWVLFLFSFAGCLQGWYWVLWRYHSYPLFYLTPPSSSHFLSAHRCDDAIA
jgi:hypothetical protein